jgi:TatD DNase family protein
MTRSQDAGVGGWIQGGVSPRDWDRQLELQERYGPGFVTSFGLHPWEASRLRDEEILHVLGELELRLAQAQALGETGLDHSARFSPEQRRMQLLAFEGQLRILSKHPKPLILHVVQAHDAALAMLRKAGPFPKGGLVHSFSASVEAAQEYLRLGFLLSISGAVAKRGFQKLKSALSSLPLDKIVVETDSPDQSPIAGTRNEPARLILIAEAIGKLRGIDRDEVLDRSTENLRKLFGLDL